MHSGVSRTPRRDLFPQKDQQHIQYGEKHWESKYHLRLSQSGLQPTGVVLLWICKETTWHHHQLSTRSCSKTHSAVKVQSTFCPSPLVLKQVSLSTPHSWQFLYFFAVNWGLFVSTSLILTGWWSTTQENLSETMQPYLCDMLGCYHWGYFYF